MNAIRFESTSRRPTVRGLRAITSDLLASVRYALDHRDESVAYALRFARGIETEIADRFIDMYVNAWTLDFGVTGIGAVERFLGELHEAGLVPDPGPIAPVAARA